MSTVSSSALTWPWCLTYPPAEVCVLVCVSACAWVCGGDTRAHILPRRLPVCSTQLAQHCRTFPLCVCVCVCVCVGTSPPHTCTETDMVPTLSINLRCIYYNSAAHMDDGCGIIRNLDHKPTPLSPVGHSDSMWHCRLLNNIIAPELCLANYNSWLRGMEGTRIEGRLWGFACVQFLADLSDQCESDREGGRYKI